LIVGACVKDKYDWDECHPRIFIQFDWSTVIKPDENVDVLITSADQDTIRMQIGPDGQEVRIEAKEYEFTGHTSTDSVLVEGRTVTVKKDAAGKYYQPDYFSGGSVTQEIIMTDEDQVVTIPMRRQMRPLIIRVLLSGTVVQNLSHVTGEISGIAMSRDINNGFVPVDNEPLHKAYITGSVKYDLTRQRDETSRIVYSDQKNLLGLDGSASQILMLTPYYNSGNSNTIEIEVTSKMLGFHTQNVDEPWVLEFTLNLIGELETSIVNWQGDYFSNIIAYSN
ncbi:MAG: hypothetical protein LUG98_03045, partial [Tannerellaceae bacterium]|nr:hypothetical protein [Tannerellaceae bacterium]